MAINFYVKYYPTNYGNYPNANQRTSWFDYLGNDPPISSLHYCTAYDKSLTLPIFQEAYTIRSSLNKDSVYSLYDLEFSYSATYSPAIPSNGTLTLDDNSDTCRVSQFNTKPVLNPWTPYDVPVFRDEILNFIVNNNVRNWENINLDLWLFQNVGTSVYTGSDCHYPVWYAGNNPNADYTVTI